LGEGGTTFLPKCQIKGTFCAPGTINFSPPPPPYNFFVIESFGKKIVKTKLLYFLKYRRKQNAENILHVLINEKLLSVKKNLNFYETISEKSYMSFY